MERSGTGVVVAILVAGGMITAAILLTQSKPSVVEKPDPFVEMKAAVAAQMIDPGSAKFQSLPEKVRDFAYC